MKVCSQCAKEINKTIVINGGEIICTECAKMMKDETEVFRRNMVAAINLIPSDRGLLEELYGKVWNTNELTEDFEVLSFFAPFVIVERKEDKLKGSLLFQHQPRFYFRFRGEEL